MPQMRRVVTGHTNYVPDLACLMVVIQAFTLRAFVNSESYTAQIASCRVDVNIVNYFKVVTLVDTYPPPVLDSIHFNFMLSLIVHKEARLVVLIIVTVILVFFLSLNIALFFDPRRLVISKWP